MKIVLATRNENKIREIKEILRGLDVELLTFRDIPNLPPVEESGKTLKENAMLKAKSAYRHTHLPSLADDSGLEVYALNGAPGVNSSRFAGENCTYQDNNFRLLSLLHGVPREKRRATFICVVALALSDEKILVKQGKVSGYIADKQVGRQGFGYDPLFYYPPKGKTFGQISKEEKNRISHRARAFLQMKKALSKGLSV